MARMLSKPIATHSALKSRKALTGSNLMSHLPSASLVNREDGDERYRRNSLYFDSLFQGTQV